MIRKYLLFAAATLISVQFAYPQTKVAAPVREVKAGDVVKLGESLTAKVGRTASSPFSGIKVSGVPVIVVVELDGGKKGVTLFYKVNSNPRLSDLYLDGRAGKFAPVAVIEDFPSWGSDNDKEVEVVDPKDPGGSSLEFEGKGSVSLLFDVPAAQAKGPIKLSANLKMSQPKEEQHSFIVIL